MRWNSVFISDLHLGSEYASSKRLAAFLEKLEVNHLFVVGDFIDFWSLEKNWSWDDTSSQVVSSLKCLQEKGVAISLFRGNHDEQFRLMSHFNGLKIEEKTVYKSLLGHSYLVWHGDQLDWFQSGFLRLISNIGSVLYEGLIFLNRFFPSRSKKEGNPNSVSSFFKVSVKRFIEYSSCYQKRLKNILIADQLDGVICGHNHFPKKARMSDTLMYYNCGDWMENCTFLAEDFAGHFKLYRFEVSLGVVEI